MPVTVALPTHAWNPGFPRAFASIARQTYADLDILILLDGVARQDRDQILDVVRPDRRTRVLDLPRCGLAAVLNVAVESSRHELIARMDDDDESLPTRLGEQVACMVRNPHLAALGGAWEVIGPDGSVQARVGPPVDPQELRWKLLVGNCFAHGSMMLRRDAIRQFGGYDTRLSKAQDYDLWLRLARMPGALGALPSVIYRHHLRDRAGGWCTSEDQARVTARLMLREWRGLLGSRLDGAGLGAIEAGLARMLASPHAAGRADIEAALCALGPSAEGLLAWLWGAWLSPPGERRAMEVCRRARVREIGARLRGEGVRAVWLWGAGEHTRRLLEHPEDLGVSVAGIVDDVRAGQVVGGVPVRAPEALPPGATVLISSDAHEEAIWARSEPLRARGVRVERMYGEGAAPKHSRMVAAASH